MKRFYVMCDSGGTGKSTVLRRIAEKHKVWLEQVVGDGPLLYEGPRPRVTPSRWAYYRERYAKTRDVVVATNDERLAGALVEVGAKRATPAEVARAFGVEAP